MRGLLYKEVLQNRGILLAGLCSVLAFTFLFVFGFEEGDGMVYQILSLLFYPAMYLMLGFLQPAIFEPDEKKASAYLYCSTPVGVKGVIAAKYWLTFLLYLLPTIWIGFISLLEKQLYHRAATGVVVALSLMFFGLFMKALEQPFMFRFGSKNGGYIKTAMMMLLTLAAMTYLLFGPVPSSWSGDNILDWILERINEGFTLKVKIVCTGIAGSILLLYYLSYRISCRVFWQGVDEYEK